MTRATRWFRNRIELLAELRGIERYATDLVTQIGRMNATARIRAAEHETDRTELSRLQAELNARDIADAVDELGLDDLEGHRHCVPLATHMHVVNQLEQRSTQPRTGGAP